MESSKTKIIDLEKIKNEKLEKEEIPFLRNELKKIQEKTKKTCDRGDKESGFFHGAEIISIDIDKLADDDLLLYKDLKDFTREKMPFDEYFKELSLHRLSIGEHLADIAEKNPNFDFRDDPRAAFSAWVVNRALGEYYQQKVRTRKGSKEKVA